MSPSSRLVVSALLLAVVGGSVWFLRDTGRDMKTRYKETARGGLAVNVIEC